MNGSCRSCAAVAAAAIVWISAGRMPSAQIASTVAVRSMVRISENTHESTARSGAAGPLSLQTGTSANDGAEHATPQDNPILSSPASVAAGKRIFDSNCAACHGDAGVGAVRAGQAIPGLDEQNRRQPPDLTDDVWDHGSSDGAIFTAIKRGLPPTLMPGFEGGIADTDIWNIVNYIRSLRNK